MGTLVPDVEVAVIGAGFSGIGTAIRLQDAGIEDFTILEQADEVGGTWRDNTYPGVAVDVSSYVYSFSFEQNPNWSMTFAPGREVYEYALHCTEKYGLRPKIRFGSEVEGMRWNEEDDLWQIDIAGGEGLTARHVVSATGVLARPKLPEIEGLDTFAGKVMHTARWDHGHDLAGRRVAFIGTGATGVQAIPEIAKVAEHLDVYQRTAIWVGPKPDYPVPRPVRALFHRLRFTQTIARAAVTGITEAVFLVAITHNREFNFLTRFVEWVCKRHLQLQVKDPELRRKLTPDYGFGCKRPTYSNDYLRTFNRSNVELVTDPIARITEGAVVTADGRTREIDTLILGTGFKVTDEGNLPAFGVIGANGRDLGEFWQTERFQAYQGTTVPGYPNFFSVFGPYAFTGSNYFNLIEIQAMHIRRILGAARSRGATRVEVSREAHDRFFAEMLRRRRSQVFFNNDCGPAHSYYFDHHGDAPVLRPTTTPEAWLRSRFVPLEDYRFEDEAAAA